MNAPCPFCDRQNQPAALVETSSLVVMPDWNPLVPGHILVIPRQHSRTYATAPDSLVTSLSRLSSRIMRFLIDCYGGTIVGIESAESGQTVQHAHVHLTPLPTAELPPLSAAADVIFVESWAIQRDPRTCFVTYNGTGYHLDHDGPSLATLRTQVAQATGLRRDNSGWRRTTTVEDIATLGDRWRQWSAQQPAGVIE